MSLYVSLLGYIDPHIITLLRVSVDLENTVLLIICIISALLKWRCLLLITKKSNVLNKYYINVGGV